MIRVLGSRYSPYPPFWRSHHRRHPRGPVARILAGFTIDSKGQLVATTLSIPTVCPNGGFLGFIVQDDLPNGQTFAEPLITLTTTGAGTFQQTPSVPGPAAASGDATYKTAFLFTAAAGFAGVVNGSLTVGGADDEDFAFTVAAPPPAPETATIDPTTVATFGDLTAAQAWLAAQTPAPVSAPVATTTAPPAAPTPAATTTAPAAA